MFRWGIIFLVIALIAAALGFGGLAGYRGMGSEIVFVVGIILFPGQPVYGSTSPVANAIFTKQTQASPRDWLFSLV